MVALVRCNVPGHIVSVVLLEAIVWPHGSVARRRRLSVLCNSPGGAALPGSVEDRPLTARSAAAMSQSLRLLFVVTPRHWLAARATAPLTLGESLAVQAAPTVIRP